MSSTAAASSVDETVSTFLGEKAVSTYHISRQKKIKNIEVRNLPPKKQE